MVIIDKEEMSVAWTMAKQRFISKYGEYAWMRFKEQASAIAAGIRKQAGVLIVKMDNRLDNPSVR